MKSITSNLLFRVFIAILAGMLLEPYMPMAVRRILATFNTVFSEFLGFSIPLIILGLVAPAIADLGKGAGKMLLLTAAIAYGSTLFSGFMTYAAGISIFPGLIEATPDASSVVGSAKELKSYFSISIPPLMGVMTSLVLSFLIGMGLSFQEDSALGEKYSRFSKNYNWSDR